MSKFHNRYPSTPIVKLSFHKINLNYPTRRDSIALTSLFYHKQMLKYFYGRNTELKFKHLFWKALKRGVSFTGLLESRVDTITTRVGYASSIYQAKQLITHHGILVNGFLVYNPYYCVRAGDVICWAKFKLLRPLHLVSSFMNNIPQYLEVDYKQKKTVFLFHPQPTQIPYPVGYFNPIKATDYYYY